MSAASTATGVNGSAAPSTGKPAVQPTEVGWLFVPQYYTFLNNDPSKLHCFYTKKSTLVHGEEQVEATLCFGQQQIHDKIVSLGFQDAKVYVSNVDSQASAAGGIIIQVLGEMSNANGAWRKFAQTFFLAEQPNGYFVLNDIFRYLKEDGEVEEEAVEIDEALQAEVAEAAAKGEQVVHQVEVQPQSVPAGITPGGDAQTTEASIVKETAAESSVPTTRLQDAQVNGIVKAQEPTPAQPDEVGMDKKVTASAAADVPATKGATEAAQATSAPSNANAPTPAINGSGAAPPPAVPSAPKTWANLAASNVTKWGSTVSAESKGVSAVKDTPAAQAGPASQKPAAASAAAPEQGQGQSYKKDGPASVFIKNVVVEQMPPQGLQAALEAQFGPMKECHVFAPKACAFGEFATVEMARKAIQMSLPVAQGGQGGVKVGTNGWTVTVEEKKKKEERSQAGGVPRGGGGGGPRGGGPAVTRGARGGTAGNRGGVAGRGGRGAA